MALKNYQTDPDQNTDISGIDIDEGCAPSGINNAIRQIMADLAAGLGGGFAWVTQAQYTAILADPNYSPTTDNVFYMVSG